MVGINRTNFIHHSSPGGWTKKATKRLETSGDDREELRRSSSPGKQTAGLLQQPMIQRRRNARVARSLSSPEPLSSGGRCDYGGSVDEDDDDEASGPRWSR